MNFLSVLLVTYWDKEFILGAYMLDIALTFQGTEHPQFFLTAYSSMLSMMRYLSTVQILSEYMGT